jgi:hypothetical protein
MPISPSSVETVAVPHGTRWWEPLVTLLVMGILGLCFVPTYYLGLYVPNTTYWCVPLIAFTMVTFTLVVVILKWVVIGRYPSTTLVYFTSAYYRWYFMDRLFEIWETWVGQWILDTPYLTLMYYFCGATLSRHVQFKTWIRECDLFDAEECIVDGTVYLGVLDKEGVKLGRVHVGWKTAMSGWGRALPGSNVTDSTYFDVTQMDQSKGLTRYERPSVLVLVQRILTPFVLIGVWTATVFGLSLAMDTWSAPKLIKQTMLIVLVPWAILFFCGFLTRIQLDRILGYTIDRLASSCTFFIDVWINETLLVPILWNLCFGSHVALSATVVDIHTLKPSRCRNVTMQAHSRLDKCTLYGKVQIGQNAQVGYGCTLLDGVTVAPGAKVPPLSVIHADQYVPSGNTQPVPRKWMGYLLDVLHRIVWVWIPLCGQIFLNLLCIQYVSTTPYVEYFLFVLLWVGNVVYVVLFGVLVQWNKKLVRQYHRIQSRLVLPLLSGSVFWNAVLWVQGTHTTTTSIVCSTVTHCSLEGTVVNRDSVLENAILHDQIVAPNSYIKQTMR